MMKWRRFKILLCLVRPVLRFIWSGKNSATLMVHFHFGPAASLDAHLVQNIGDGGPPIYTGWSV